MVTMTAHQTETKYFDSVEVKNKIFCFSQNKVIKLHRTRRDRQRAQWALAEHKSVAADSISKMAAPIAVAGKRERPMVMAFVRDQSIKAPIRAHGIMVLKCLACTFGLGKFHRRSSISISLKCRNVEMLKCWNVEKSHCEQRRCV